MATTNDTQTKLSRKYAGMVSFARFCGEWNLKPNEAAALLILAQRAFKANDRDCNTGRDDGEKVCDRFTRHCNTLGIYVRWPGLWPQIKLGVDGTWANLPEC